jgi:DNA-binding CsgD family transcriptional regulator/PAS domain-containing protein
MIGSDILLDLYHCPAEPDRWRRVLDCVCDKVGVASAVVQQFRASENAVEHMWTVRDSASLRNAELHDRLVNNNANPRLNLRLGRPFGHNAVVRDSDRFDPGCPHWAGLRERLRAAGLGESIGASVRRESGGSLAIVLHRRYGDFRPFTRDDEQFLRQLLPHVENAVNLGQRLDCQASRLRQIEKVAERLHVGILTFRQDRRISWANDAAQEILRRSPHLRSPAGRLGAPSGTRYDELEILLRNGLGVSSGVALDSVVLGAGDDDELHIVLLPPASDAEEAALLMSEPRRSPALPAEDIARLLRVTPAEARVAAALCAGNTLKEYAQSRGISEGSARNQLKQVLAKTGARRQSELIGHLCRSVIFQSRHQRSQLRS